MVTIHSFSIKYLGFSKMDIFGARKMSKKKISKILSIFEFQPFPFICRELFLHLFSKSPEKPFMI
jgi:hypothetical protein